MKKLNRLPGPSWLGHMSIGRKLNLGFGILVMLTLLVGGLGFLASRGAIVNINRTEDLHVPSALAATRAQANLLTMLADMRGYLISGNPRTRESYDQNRLAFEDNLAELKTLSANWPNPDDAAKLEQLSLTFEEWVALPEQLFSLYDSPLDNQPAVRLARLSVQPLNTTIQEQIALLIALQEERPLSEENLDLLKEMVNFQASHSNLVAGLNGYATTGDETFLNLYQESLPLNEAAWEVLQTRRADLTAEQELALTVLERARERLLRLPDQIIDILSGERSEEALFLFRTQAVPRAQTMLDLLIDLNDSMQANLQSDLNRGRVGLTQAQWQTVIAGLIAVLLGGVLSYIIRANIVGPVQRLTKTAEAITAGNLTAQASVESRDEIGRLATTTNFMTSRLRDTIQRLENRTQQLEQLRQASLNLSENLEMEAVLAAILAGVHKLLADVRSIHLFFHQKGELMFALGMGQDEQMYQPGDAPHPNGLNYRVVESREPIIVPDMRIDTLYADSPSAWNGSIVSLPLKVGQRLVAVLTIYKNQVPIWTEAELRILLLLADQAAIAIDKATLYNDIRLLSRSYERFVPRQFLSFLGKESIVDVELGDQVQQEMTVFFSDIRDFTSLSEKMTPSENFRFVNGFLSRMEPHLISNNGVIDKYIGDAIMALFPMRADDAIQGGIDMLISLREYNTSRVEEGYPEIRIGIGMHTGLLMLGTIGGHSRMDGTVISDVVNVASRIEGLTKIYGATLMITEQTFLKLSDPDAYHIRVIDRVMVKGKSRPIRVYEVFDGDQPEELALKMQSLADFEAAIEHYNQRDIAGAKQYFQQVLSINPADKAAQLYFGRCEQLLSQDELPEDWDAVTVLTHK